jgi:hypothetical protein
MFQKFMIAKLPVALLLALSLIVGTFSQAFAHHTGYEANVSCDEVVTANGFYVGNGKQSGRRVIVLTDVVVNGEAYVPSWSTKAPEQFVPLSEYDGPKEGLTITGTQYVLDIIHPGFPIFEYEVQGFVDDESAWGGNIQIYSVQDGKLEKAAAVTNITKPSAQTECAKPAVTIYNLCSNEGIEVTLSNPNGGADAKFTSALNDEEATSYTVAPNQSVKITYVVAEDSDFVIHVTESTTGLQEDYPNHRDCVPPPAKPKARIISLCYPEKTALVLDNREGGQPFVFTVSIGSAEPVDYKVDPGTEIGVDIPFGEDEEVIVVVTGEGFSNTFTATRNCRGSDFNLTFNCDAAFATAWFTNTSSVEQQFNFTTNRDTDPVAIMVRAGETVTREVEIGEDETITGTVIVVGHDGYTESVAVTRDCVTPPPTPANPKIGLSEFCKNEEQSQQLVTLQNLGDLPMTFQLYYDDPTTKNVDESQTAQVFEVLGKEQVEVSLNLPKTIKDFQHLRITNSANNEVLESDLPGCDQPTALPGGPPPSEPYRLNLPSIEA